MENIASSKHRNVNKNRHRPPLHGLGAAPYFSFLNWVEKKLKYLFCEGFCNTVTFFIKSETLTVNVTLCAFNLVLSITIIHQESSLDELNEVDNWRHHQDHKLVPPHLVDTRHDRWHICCFLVHPQKLCNSNLWHIIIIDVKTTAPHPSRWCDTVQGWEH